MAGTGNGELGSTTHAEISQIGYGPLGIHSSAWCFLPTFSVHGGILSGLGLYRFVYVVSATVSSNLYLSCCVQKTLFLCHHGLWLLHSFYLLFHVRLSLEGRGLLKTYLIGLSASKLLTLWTLSSCRALLITTHYKEKLLWGELSSSPF